jgi:hypothetical protein
MPRSSQRWFEPLTLLLPALLPSWRFFASVGPSPRIQFAWLTAETDEENRWQDFWPRPAHLSFGYLLLRLIWNPAGNEALYLVACCERLLEEADEHWQNEIWQRVLGELQHNPQTTYLRFRIVLIERDGTRLTTEPVFVSEIRRIEATRPEKLP